MSSKLSWVFCTMSSMLVLVVVEVALVIFRMASRENLLTWRHSVKCGHYTDAQTWQKVQDLYSIWNSNRNWREPES